MTASIKNATVHVVIDEDRSGETRVAAVCSSAKDALVYARRCIEEYANSSRFSAEDIDAALADFDAEAAMGEAEIGAGDPNCGFFVSIHTQTIL